MKQELSFGEVGMGEEWLHRENANGGAGILQKAGLGNCIHQVLLLPPSAPTSPCVSPAAPLVIQ